MPDAYNNMTHEASTGIFIVRGNIPFTHKLRSSRHNTSPYRVLDRALIRPDETMSARRI